MHLGDLFLFIQVGRGEGCAVSICQSFLLAKKPESKGEAGKEAQRDYTLWVSHVPGCFQLPLLLLVTQWNAGSTPPAEMLCHFTAFECN